ncbi:MAG: hypothetical protein AAF907_03030, partial [Planctomycetota bacterium]
LGTHLNDVLVSGNGAYALSSKLPVTGEPVTARASDCFKALQSLREQAATAGWALHCMGARRNVWPSGMARDMGGGLKAYLMTMGKHARREDLVGIFEPDDAPDGSTVAEQKAFFEKWLDSLR